MKATGKRCRHCKGNIVTTYDKYTQLRHYCLQCGRDISHRCERCSKSTPHGAPYANIERKLQRELGRAQL